MPTQSTGWSRSRAGDDALRGTDDILWGDGETVFPLRSETNKKNEGAASTSLQCPGRETGFALNRKCHQELQIHILPVCYS